MSEMIESLPEVNFEETESQKMIAEMVKEFGGRKIRPKMMEWDERQEFPIDVFHQMGDLGLMGVLVPQEYGAASGSVPGDLLNPTPDPTPETCAR